jgi:hypothetical protein
MPDKWFNHQVGYPADDYVHGGMGDDEMWGHQATGGVDRFYGEDGNDWIVVSQGERPAVKAIVDCGPGFDEVRFDEGVDVVRDNCETKNPV